MLLCGLASGAALASATCLEADWFGVAPRGAAFGATHGALFLATLAGPLALQNGLAQRVFAEHAAAGGACSERACFTLTFAVEAGLCAACAPLLVALDRAHRAAVALDDGDLGRVSFAGSFAA